MTDLYPNLFKNLTRNPITIILLDGRKQTMVYDKTTKLSMLFEETCSLCNLDSDNLFGFATLMDDYYAFLNLDTKVCKINFKEISKKTQNNVLFQSHFSPIHKDTDDSRRLSQSSKQNSGNNKLLKSTSSTKSAPVYRVQDSSPVIESVTPVIYFRIKSYVFSHCLRDKTTKSLYFLQLLRNVLDYKLKCVDEIYLQLGSYAIQAFYGDFDFILRSAHDDRLSVTSSNTESSEYSHSPTLARLSRISNLSPNLTPQDVQTGRYFEPKKFFPAWIIAKYTQDFLFKEIPQLHSGLDGMSRVEAEFSYIRMASAQYSNFNLHLFPVRDEKMTNFGKSPSSVIANGRSGIKMHKNKQWLGLSPAGLEIHQMKHAEYIEHLSTIKWSDIDEVTHKSSRISVHVGERTLKLTTNTKMQADHLFWLTRHMHMYQTKARLNATCTAEALESAERQKYRESYIYMDLEDLKLHGLINPPDNTDSLEMFHFGGSAVVPEVVRLPFVNTPAAPPRRNPSKAKPLKMKDLVRMANSGNESTNGSPSESFHAEKHPQYIKKTRPTSQLNNYAPTINKAVHSPAIQSKVATNWPLYLEETDVTESEHSVARIYHTLNDSDISSSMNESESRSPTMPIVRQPGRFVSLSRDMAPEQDVSESSQSPEPGSGLILPPPRQFREPLSHVGKSTSLDICDLGGRQDEQPLPQRHQSDTLITYVELSRSIPMLLGLCQEFHNTQLLEDIKAAKVTKTPAGLSTGMKSWKSDVLFHLDTCLNDDDDDDDSEQHRGRARTVGASLPRRAGSYRDLISLTSSSSSDSDNDHDSVEISSISSFELHDIKYSRIDGGRRAPLTII